MPLSLAEYRELVDLLKADNSDLLRGSAILQQRIELRDDLIASAEVTIQRLQMQLDTEQRLADARVEQAKAACSCPPPWQRKVWTATTFVLGGLAGRGSCGYGD